MTTSLVDAESVLAVDIGTIYTRAALFDVVDGQYHFIAQGFATSTVNAPYRDASEGVQDALNNLKEITGRSFVDEHAGIILPAQANGAGVDRLIMTYSAGPELRVVIAGLLTDVSVESARRLASTCSAKIVEAIGLSDRRKPEQQIDAMANARPDLIILAGGTEQGAGRSVLKMAELISMACRVIPAGTRPKVLYAGNSVLAKRIQDNLEKWTKVQVAPNLRPSIDIENLYPAMEVFGQAVTEARASQVGGFGAFASIASAPILPTSFGFGRMIRFLSQVYDSSKGVMGIDLGSASTNIAAAVSGRLSNQVLPYGSGAGLANLLKVTTIEDIARWLPMHMSLASLKDFLWQKTLQPGTIPATVETLAIEQAVARQVMRVCMDAARSNWSGFKSAFEPILASGAALCQASSPYQSLLMILDGLQPVGVTTINLDANHLTARLGAIAKINPILPVQIIESGAILNLGTVICPVSSARYGTAILRVRLEYEEGSETRMEVRQGAIQSLPLQPGQAAKIHLQPLHGAEIDPHGRKGLVGGVSSFRIVGGACGAVIDARGRPLVLPVDASRRRDMIKKWYQALAG